MSRSRAYVIDTNLYIRAFRDAGELALLKRFLLRAGERVHLHGVVALELRAGARTEDQQDAVEAFLQPYVARSRVIAPSFQACLEAGRVLSDLVARERMVLATVPASFRHDVVLATSCREAGAVLLTANFADFTRIKRHLRGFEFADAWPLLGRG